MVFGLFAQLQSDAPEFRGHGIAAQSRDGGDFVVGHFVQPKQNESLFDGVEPVDQRVKFFQMFGAVALLGRQPDAVFERECASVAAFAAVARNAGVQADAIYPRCRPAASFEPAEAPPQMEQNFLIEVVEIGRFRA